MLDAAQSALQADASPSHARAQLPPCVLIADDQPHILDALELLLEPEGYRIEKATSPYMVLDALKSGTFDALLLDLNYTRDTTSGREGLDLLSEIRSHDAHLPVIVMTAWANVELAVEAMHRGANDFIQKPWDNARLLTVLRTQIELNNAVRRATRARSREPPPPRAEPPRDDRHRARHAARPRHHHPHRTLRRQRADHRRARHRQRSRRPDPPRALLPRLALAWSPSTPARCPKAPSSRELFGHVKGAFTDARTERIGRFELAEGGTLFLDEIANVPPRQQAKLLRVLETGEMERVGSSKTKRVNVRVISATNADLHKEVEEGRFRADLLFRLNTVEIHLPPLRERREDIPALAAHFLARYSQRYRKAVQGIDPPAMELMLHYAWPGNVRELDHTIERAVLMSREDIIEVSDLGLSPARVSTQALEEMSLESVESILIRKALSRCNGNVSQAAEALGLSRGALYRRMEKYGI